MQNDWLMSRRMSIATVNCSTPALVYSPDAVIKFIEDCDSHIRINSVAFVLTELEQEACVEQTSRDRIFTEECLAFSKIVNLYVRASQENPMRVGDNQSVPESSGNDIVRLTGTHMRVQHKGTPYTFDKSGEAQRQQPIQPKEATGVDDKHCVPFEIGSTRTTVYPKQLAEWRNVANAAGNLSTLSTSGYGKTNKSEDLHAVQGPQQQNHLLMPNVCAGLSAACATPAKCCGRVLSVDTEVEVPLFNITAFRQLTYRELLLYLPVGTLLLFARTVSQMGSHLMFLSADVASRAALNGLNVTMLSVCFSVGILRLAPCAAFTILPTLLYFTVGVEDVTRNTVLRMGERLIHALKRGAGATFIYFPVGCAVIAGREADCKGRSILERGRRVLQSVPPAAAVTLNTATNVFVYFPIGVIFEMAHSAQKGIVCAAQTPVAHAVNKSSIAVAKAVSDMLIVPTSAGVEAVSKGTKVCVYLSVGLAASLMTSTKTRLRCRLSRRESAHGGDN